MGDQLPVLGLHVENVQRIKFAEISPDRNTVIISGANGAGKSSLCNALRLALGDKVASKLITRPITEGKDHAVASVDLGKFRITRTWNNSGKSTTKIENIDGAVYKSPAEMLKKMVGNLAFDPLEFSLMSEKEQVAVLLDLINLPIDLDQLAEERQEAYDLRTRINRQIRDLEGERKGLIYNPQLPEQEISTAEIMAEHQAASQRLSENNAIRGTYKQAVAVASTLADEITRLEQELSEKRRQLGKQNQYIENLKSQIETLVDPDLESILARMHKAEDENKLIRQMQKNREITKKIEKEKVRSDALSAKIKDIDDLKARTIAAVKMPIDGLGFDESGILFNGIPLKQCSTSEALKVGCAIVIAIMKQQAEDHVAAIIIRDGSLLDADNLATLEKTAIQEGVQFWIEVVDTTGERGIYIEDGEVRR